MKSIISSQKLLAFGLLACGLFTGCETTDGGGGASGGVYYGTGFYDPWYYGSYHQDVGVIVTPPNRPVDRPRPSHPIATPAPASRPMPSIPSTPRASFRR